MPLLAAQVLDFGPSSEYESDSAGIRGEENASASSFAQTDTGVGEILGSRDIPSEFGRKAL